MQVVREQRERVYFQLTGRLLAVALVSVAFAQVGCQSAGMFAGAVDGDSGSSQEGGGAKIVRVSLQSDEVSGDSDSGDLSASGGVRVRPRPGARLRSQTISGSAAVNRGNGAIAAGKGAVAGEGSATSVLESGENSDADAGVESEAGAESIRGDRVAAGAGSGHSLLPRTVEGNAVPAEGGMLDRFRALYSPRGEDSGERVRRQMLRWSDPFGLLKERTEAGGVGGESGAAELDQPGVVGAERAVSELGVESDRDGVTRGGAGASALMDAMIGELEGELSAWPTGAGGQPERIAEWRKKQTDLRMLYCVSGRSADAARVIEGLPREEQEFWQSMMLAMNRCRAGGEGELGTEQYTEALGQVRAAARALQPLSKLEIHRLQFCTRIDGFGNVTAFPTADFEPGQRLLLYAGVRNFRSELTSEGRYRSEFAAVVEFLREEDGEVLERIRLPQIPDECDEERTDYFQSFELTAPVLEGGYIVRLQLRDQLTRQTTEARLRMRIR